MKNFSVTALLAAWLLSSPALFSQAAGSYPSGVKKIKDIVIYNDPTYYSAFPSAVKKKDGEFLLAFRRAPNPAIFGEKGYSHVNPNSYLVGLTSKDGESWTQEPHLIYAHAFGGSQDPCLLRLKDGTLLCASYGWAFLRPDTKPSEKVSVHNGNVAFLGGYLVRSTDNGKTWQGPLYPPQVKGDTRETPMGKPLPAYNRGALCEGKNGQIYWSVAVSIPNSQGKSTICNHLLISKDKGLTWEYSAPVAVDDKVVFNEASVYETPKGDVISFLRTADFEDFACIARSTDGGKTFSKWQSMGFKGHPLQALRLPDNRVLLVYGYRHKPFGIRARILNAECTDFETAPEIVLRDDGGTTDLGYPWAVQLDKNRVLVTYYYNINDGIRHIAGTILQID